MIASPPHLFETDKSDSAKRGLHRGHYICLVDPSCKLDIKCFETKSDTKEPPAPSKTPHIKYFSPQVLSETINRSCDAIVWEIIKVVGRSCVHVENPDDPYQTRTRSHSVKILRISADSYLNKLNITI